ncbi:hypothetical protein CDAR_57611 [Caerostris darwini]|uniref:Uncharacterized protein n=1 Tax=Caerostris darwini TaxID=1538125 RepID=A0AAV4SY62_9ARAC|nr:hypothetical protein CDAR_57611 [Caerostris darwini]
MDGFRERVNQLSLHVTFCSFHSRLEFGLPASPWQRPKLQKKRELFQGMIKMAAFFQLNGAEDSGWESATTRNTAAELRTFFPLSLSIYIFRAALIETEKGFHYFPKTRADFIKMDGFGNASINFGFMQHSVRSTHALSSCVSMATLEVPKRTGVIPGHNKNDGILPT